MVSLSLTDVKQGKTVSNSRIIRYNEMPRTRGQTISDNRLAGIGGVEDNGF